MVLTMHHLHGGVVVVAAMVKVVVVVVYILSCCSAGSSCGCGRCSCSCCSCCSCCCCCCCCSLQSLAVVLPVIVVVALLKRFPCFLLVGRNKEKLEKLFRTLVVGNEVSVISGRHLGQVTSLLLHVLDFFALVLWGGKGGPVLLCFLKCMCKPLNTIGLPSLASPVHKCHPLWACAACGNCKPPPR